MGEPAKQMAGQQQMKDHKRFIAGDVMKYLDEHRGIIVHADDIAKEINSERVKVANCIGNLRRDKGMNIDTIVPGKTYIFHGEKRTPTTGKLLEVIAETRTGAFICQDEEGNVYKAEALD